MFDGNPRSIFSLDQHLEREQLEEALSSCDVLNTIETIKQGDRVWEKRYSHRVLQMVPSKPLCRLSRSLWLCSDYVGEQLISKLETESLRGLSEYAIEGINNPENETTSTQENYKYWQRDCAIVRKNESVYRGKIFELLVQRFFTTQSRLDLEFRSLEGSELTNEGERKEDGRSRMEPFKLTLEGVMKKVDFTDVAEIRKIPQEVIYYQPMVKIFGALSALILDGVNNRCYGRLMTTSHENSLAWSPFNCVLKRLAEINLSEHFCVCFVVPTHMQAKYNRQPILSENQLLHLEPGDEGYVPQFVCGFNAFAAN